MHLSQEHYRHVLPDAFNLGMAFHPGMAKVAPLELTSALQHQLGLWHVLSLVISLLICCTRAQQWQVEPPVI